MANGTGHEYRSRARAISVPRHSQRMAYSAAMELQTQIDELKASLNRQKLAIITLVVLAGVAVFFAVKPQPHGIITCDGWRVVDKNGTLRIEARIWSGGEASVVWKDKEGTMRIGATTLPNGDAVVAVRDKDKKSRLEAGTRADGTVRLPTTDLKPK